MRPPALGSTQTVSLEVTERMTVPGLLPEIGSWSAMPPVLATAMLVAIMEWAALETLLPFLDAGEHSLGILVEMSHTAPTPRGGRVRARATIRTVEGRFVDFDIEAFDDNGRIGGANHRRAVIDEARFAERIEAMRRRP